jgi:hypothetical protein
VSRRLLLEEAADPSRTRERAQPLRFGLRDAEATIRDPVVISAFITQIGDRAGSISPLSTILARARYIVPTSGSAESSRASISWVIP